MGRSVLFLALVWRHLLAHRLRALLTVVGVSLGVAVAVAVQLANHTALQAFEDAVGALAGEARLRVISDAGPLDERVLTRLAPVTEQARFSPVIEGMAVRAGHREDAFKLVGVDTLAPGAFRAYGELETAKAPDPEGVVITRSVARRLNLAPGQRLPLWVNDRRHDLPVAGIVNDTGANRALDPQVAFLDVAAAQELLGRVGSLDRLDVILAPGAELGSVRSAIASRLPDGVRVGEPDEAMAQARRMLGAFRTNLLALSFVALIVGAYLVYNAVSVSVVQRRSEIATLRALGTSRRDIFALFALEAGLVGLAGAALGLLLGGAMASLAVGAVSRTVNAIYLAAPVTQVAWTPMAFASGLGLGVGLALVAAAIPAAEAASTPPALAMRPGAWEGTRQGLTIGLAGAGTVALGLAWLAAGIPPVGVVPVGGYVAAALAVVGGSALAPGAVALVATLARRATSRLSPPLRLGAGQFGAAPGRNGVAAAALMVGVAMMVGVSTMVGSFRTTVAAWADASFRADYYLQPEVTGGARQGATLDPALSARVKVLPGVAAVDPLRRRTLPYEGATIVLGADDLATRSRYGGFLLTEPLDLASVLRACVGTDRVIASEALALKHGVRRGGTIMLPTPSGPKAFEVAALYYDYTSDQGYVVMDLSTYRRHWHDPAITHLAVYAEPGASSDRMRQALTGAVAGKPVTVTPTGALRDEVLNIFDATFAITYALHVIALAVSLLGVTSTLFTLVLERQRALSTVRALGLTRGQVRAMVVTEAGLVGLTGAGLGLGTGALLAWVLITVINRQSFGWTVGFAPPWGFVIGALALVITAAMLAGFGPAQRAASAPIAEGLRDA